MTSYKASLNDLIQQKGKKSSFHFFDYLLLTGNLKVILDNGKFLKFSLHLRPFVQLLSKYLAA